VKKTKVSRNKKEAVDLHTSEFTAVVNLIKLAVISKHTLSDFTQFVFVTFFT